MVMQARYESVLKTLGFRTGIALQRSLQEVTSQDDSLMPDISGYIWERVKRDRPRVQEYRVHDARPLIMLVLFEPAT